MTGATQRPTPIVLDTNIILNVYVFNDPAAAVLNAALESGTHQWIATQAMRDELERVLTYKHIAPRLALRQLNPLSILAQFDKFASIKPLPSKATATCKDADDQKFIDLAVAHKSLLLSKDHAVLCMAKRLLALGVAVAVNL